MKQLRIIHSTEYFYKTPVQFGPHQAMLRPLEGHAVHIENAKLELEPSGKVRWLRDIYNNSIAVLAFDRPAKKLRVFSEVDVTIYEDEPRKGLIDSRAEFYPFQYAANEQMDIVPYRVPSYPYDGSAVQSWLREVYQPGEKVPTFDLLQRLNTRIFESFAYAQREEMGVQLPCRTLALQSGTCRDFAVFLMEAARHLGFAARFVTGYILMEAGQHGATHAWTEIYVPGMGWCGFDPTNHKLAGFEHVAVGVAREHEKAVPLSGYWEGPADAYERMDVSVQVVAIPAGSQRLQ